MAGKREKKEKRKRERIIYLASIAEFVHRHITEAVCNEVFYGIRDKERQREWTLYLLARFWIEVVLTAPEALTRVLEVTRGDAGTGLLPAVSASDEAFYQRCKSLSSNFFQALYFKLVEGVAPAAPRAYARRFLKLRRRFSSVVVVDGSKLAAIAHRLKILWNERAVILPGSVTAVYDIFLGFAVQLWFEPDAAASEFGPATLAFESLAPRTLVLGDRLYACPQVFDRLEALQCYGLFRRSRNLTIKKVKLLSSEEIEGRTIEDWIVEAGAGSNTRTLRMVLVITKGKRFSVLTNVLDPQLLSADEAADLYPVRWQVERLFFDLKEVLDLHRFYVANPNGVAMQVFAAAIVHIGFRLAQAKIAKETRVPPEELSPKKLFPRLAAASIKVIEAEWIFKLTAAANPGVKLRKPSWDKLPYTRTTLSGIQVEHRKGKRRRRRFCKGRKNWKSIMRVKGASKLT